MTNRTKNVAALLVVALGAVTGVGTAVAVATAATTAPATTAPATTAPATTAPAAGSPATTAPAAGAPTQPAAASGGTTVSFTIPAWTGIRLDANGQPDAVLTNTEVAPRSTDVFWVEHPDGTRGPASTDLVNQILAWAAPGDWTSPGVWHPYPGQ